MGIFNINIIYETAKEKQNKGENKKRKRRSTQESKTREKQITRRHGIQKEKE